jgi:SpoVK/Ycf46/Vps4 family AAA+-type ATPase
VVSKYIGETEKNLRRVFDAAEDGSCVLCFDEADALFGRRSEVKDSHDRYANIEINYLLQRMETFAGLAILTTNRKSALDPAFVRRLRFMVPFGFPGVQERAQIWRKALPAAVPVSDEGLDFDWLARHTLTGASIKNAALAGCFLAAEAGEKLSMAHLLEALRTELMKLGHPLREADFRWRPREVKAG